MPLPPQLLSLLVLVLPAFVLGSLSFYEEPTISHLTTDNLDNWRSDIDGSFVLFYSSRCKPCKTMLPVFAAAASGAANLRERGEYFPSFAAVDCYYHPTICDRWTRNGIPTTVLFRDNGWTAGSEYFGKPTAVAIIHFLRAVNVGGVLDDIVPPEGAMYDQLTDSEMEKLEKLEKELVSRNAGNKD
eukprot:NODE_5043_length_725_cov_22.961538_g4680_i0.p1 GENE.NODE_5043_length_725_cov_22.961538_g4680_i0~~NODE_5043_length_725_cov_22.961538_g4680_i0.p1  ORF type:complete len:186 (-),score=33.15 NODE_5043_length_725_cov_22.961538_g4680_i0:51-608(-)